MNVMRELVPYNIGVPVTEVFDVVWVYPDCSGFFSNRSLEFVVSEGFEGVPDSWI